MRAVLLSLLACVASACASQTPVAAPALSHAHGETGRTAPSNATLEVTGPAGQRISLSADSLAALPHVELTIDIHGVRHEFSGVALTDILARVGAPRGAALRGADLRHVVLVTARDGYQVALSLAETDSAIRTSRVIVADRMDGAPRPVSDGPFRLIVEGDLKPARSARMIERIDVRKLH